MKKSDRTQDTGNIIEIADLTLPELQVYTSLNEAQLLHYYEPASGIFIAESPKVISRALDGGYEPVSVLVERKQVLEDAETIAVLGKCGNVPVYTAEFEVLTKLTGFKLTRGMLCAMKRRRLPGLQEICNGCDRIAVLENVMNPTNVGAIFRSAAALHMDAVILTGGCSNPLYRRASRVSMGTVFQIPWTFVDNSVIWPEEGMKILRELGFKTAAMALKEEGNVLLLDEPTNDIDVNTLRALEEGLEDFAGCAVVISHDRWFLDRICTHILAFEGDSNVFYFEGSYSEYEENKMKRLGNEEPKRVRYRKLMTD